MTCEKLCHQHARRHFCQDDRANVIPMKIGILLRFVGLTGLLFRDTIYLGYGKEICVSMLKSGEFYVVYLQAVTGMAQGGCVAKDSAQGRAFLPKAR